MTKMTGSQGKKIIRGKYIFCSFDDHAERKGDEAEKVLPESLREYASFSTLLR